MFDDFIAAARTITPAAVGDQNVGLEVWEKKKVGPYALHPTADGDVTFRSLMVKYDVTASELIAANALGPFAGDADLAELEGLRAKARAATVAASSSAPFEKRRKTKGSALKDRDPW